MSAAPTSAFAVLTAMAVLLSPSSVLAQETPGSYASLYVGSSNLSSTTVTESRLLGPVLSGKASFGSGLGAGGAIGYRYGNGLAAELAWDYRRHDLKRVGAAVVGGDFASNTFFLNGYYRFPKTGSLRPFVGAGIGWNQEIDIDIERGGLGLSYSRSGSVAFQAIVGGEIELTDKWSLVADLRWMRINAGAFKPENAAAGGLLLNKPKYQPAAFHLGVSYRF